MTALHKVERKLTAKDMAKKLGVNERTVRRYIALSRNDYESNAESRRKTAYVLHHEKGLKWSEVAEEMDSTENAVKSLAKRYKQITQQTRG